MVIFCLLIEAMWKISGFDIHFTFIHVIAIMMGKDTGKEDIQKIMNGDIAGEMAYLGIALFVFRNVEMRVCAGNQMIVGVTGQRNTRAGKRAQDLGKVQFIKCFA